METKDCQRCKNQYLISDFFAKNGEICKTCYKCREKNQRDNLSRKIQQNKQNLLQIDKCYVCQKDFQPYCEGLVVIKSCEDCVQKYRTNGYTIETKGLNKGMLVKQCSGCKRKLTEQFFINSSGKIIKSCSYCRKKFTKRHENMKGTEKYDQRLQKNRENQPWKKYRQKKKEEDLQGYLAHNAKVHKNWYHQNKESVSLYSKGNFNSRLRSIKISAQKKNTPWDNDMDDAYCYHLMQQPCYYCNSKDSQILNSIDKLDHSGIYQRSNCVSSCIFCNMMKNCLSPDVFIKKCMGISLHNGGKGIYYEEAFPDSKSCYFSEYKYNSKQKGLDFLLSKEDFLEIISQSCNYCGKKSQNNHINGIDRKCSKQGYTLDNSVPCCTSCNYMKREYDIEEFLQKCKDISNFWIDKDIPVWDNPSFKHIQDKNREEIPKQKIIITKQQPNKEKVYKEPSQTPYIPKVRQIKRGVNLPLDCGITSSDMPEQTSYQKQTASKGDYFSVSRTHPLHKKIGRTKDWNTTMKKSVSTQEKYQQMMAYLQNLNIQ